METLHDITEQERSLNENMSRAALDYLALGYRPIPLVPGTKQGQIKWKEFQVRSPNEREVDAWFGDGKPNIAFVTGNGVVVVDVDDPALLDVVIEHCGDTPMRTKTPSGGFHLYYRMRAGVRYGSAVRIKDRPLDLRCEGAYVVVPWSRNAEGKAYQWVGAVLPAIELPLLKVSWLRERTPTRSLKPIDVSDNMDVMVHRARAYVARIEGSISGQRGHDKAMRVAGVLCQKFALTLEQAWPIFKEWSETSCEPPWSDAEILHKLQDAIRLRFDRGLRKID